MTHVDLTERMRALNIGSRAGLHRGADRARSQRCLNCDVQTHFTTELCIECDACIDVCPVDCLTITGNAEEPSPAPPSDGADEASRISCCTCRRTLPQTARVMVKDEDLCLHCGLCAERCPTAAWDMRKFELLIPYAGAGAGVAV